MFGRLAALDLAIEGGVQAWEHQAKTMVTVVLVTFVFFFSGALVPVEIGGKHHSQR